MREITAHASQPPGRFISGLAVALLLLLALMQFSASGVIRGGDDNEGSGIGGTGRMLSPTGESGIGGTGFKPFLGMNADNEVEVLHDPALRDTAITETLPYIGYAPPTALPVIARVAQVTRDLEKTLNSNAVDISETIQLTADVNALALDQLREEVLALTADVAHMPEAATTAMSWSELARALRDEQDMANPERTSLANADYATDDPARLARPERLQRPQLPPLQRVSPLQRTAILPPRVKPLRL